MGRQSPPAPLSMTEPMLVDTSVWIDFFHNKKTKQVQLLANSIANDYAVLLTATIVQEILQGIKSDSDYKRVKEILFHFDILELNPTEAAIGAADLYRSARKKGATIRKSNDCLIAFHAIYFKLPLLENDSDYKQISKHSELKLVK